MYLGGGRLNVCILFCLFVCFCLAATTIIENQISIQVGQQVDLNRPLLGLVVSG